MTIGSAIAIGFIFGFACGIAIDDRRCFGRKKDKRKRKNNRRILWSVETYSKLLEHSCSVE